MLEYGSMQGLRYMDMVIKETLRKYPPTGVLSRACTKVRMITNTRLGCYLAKRFCQLLSDSSTVAAVLLPKQGRGTFRKPLLKVTTCSNEVKKSYQLLH